MNSEEWLYLYKSQLKMLNEVYGFINFLENNINKIEPLNDLVEAKAEDICERNLIYLLDSENEIFAVLYILEVCNPTDRFKGFVAHDGCRYGLDGAYVEKKEGE